MSYNRTTFKNGWKSSFMLTCFIFLCGCADVEKPLHKLTEKEFVFEIALNRCLNFVKSGQHPLNPNDISEIIPDFGDGHIVRLIILDGRFELNFGGDTKARTCNLTQNTWEVGKDFSLRRLYVGPNFLQEMTLKAAEKGLSETQNGPEFSVLQRHDWFEPGSAGVNVFVIPGDKGDSEHVSGIRVSRLLDR